MIVCVNCGQVNETAASRCLRCGASIFEYPSYLGSAGVAPSGPPPAPPPPSVPPPKPAPPPHKQPLPPPYGSPYGASQTAAPPPMPLPPPVSPPLAHPLPVQLVVVVGGFACPYCRTTLPPRITYRTSPAGWVIFALLLLLCWPLFWVGFLFQEECLRCRNCGRRLA